MLSSGMIQGCILWEFNKDPRRISMGILYLFLWAQQKSLAIQRPWFYKNVYRPLHMDLYWEDRCKDSKGIERSLKDFYKDSSWNSIGFP